MNATLTVFVKRGLIASLLVLVLLLGLSACQLPSFGGDETAEVAAEPLATETGSPTPSEVPSRTPIPSQTPVPSATIKPTLRPSATPFVPTLRPTWTPSPTLSPTATPQVHLFLEEDFSNITDNYWIRDSGENWQTGIARGAYFMIVEALNVEITSARTWIRQAEVRIEADVWRGSGTGYYGFTCRETKAETYFSVFVTSDGYYGFGELRAGKVTWFESYPSNKIALTVDTPMRLRADCRGNSLSLYINGELIDRYEVPGLGPGYVSMMAGTRYEDETITVFFDNLQIWIP